MFYLSANSFQHKKLYNFSEKLLKRWAIKLFGEFGIDAEFEKGMKTGFTSFTRGRYESDSYIPVKLVKPVFIPSLIFSPDFKYIRRVWVTLHIRLRKKKKRLHEF